MTRPRCGRGGGEPCPAQRPLLARCAGDRAFALEIAALGGVGTGDPEIDLGEAEDLRVALAAAARAAGAPCPAGVAAGRRPPTCAPRRGALVLYVGPMFSGKTSALLEEAAWSLRAGLRVIFLVPEVDDRHGAGAVVSHAGDALARLGVEARVAPAGPAGVEAAEGLARAADVVLVDEAQFWDPSIAGALRRLAAGGRRVAAGGLDLDWRREPFEATAALLAWADVVGRLAARCSSCGAPAPYTARLAGGEERVLVGGAERYAPRCARCHGGERSGALPGEPGEDSVHGGACAGGRIVDGTAGG